MSVDVLGTVDRRIGGLERNHQSIVPHKFVDRRIGGLEIEAIKLTDEIAS